MGEHPGAVDALPPERRVREAVGAVPRQLLGDEAAHAAGGEHLRQPGRVAEHVGDPHLAAPTAEVLLEVALAVDDLADDALAGRQVHVRLDPHPADRHPLPVGDLVDDAGEQLRLALGDPRVLLRLRAREPVVGLGVHQRDRRGERAAALAHRLAERPQPRRVDVRVAGGDDAVGARSGRHGERAGDARRGGVGARPRQAPRRRGRGRGRSPPAGVHRRGSSSGSVRITPSSTSRSWTSASASGSTTHQLGAVEAVQRPVAGRVRRAQRRRAGTAGTSGSTPPRRPARPGPGPSSPARPGGAGGCPGRGRPLASRTSPSHWKPGASMPEAEVDERLDATARPRRRDLAGEPEPRRRPRRTPPLADVERRRARRATVRPRRSTARRCGCTSGSTRSCELAGDPLLDQVPVVVHRVILSHRIGAAADATRHGTRDVASVPMADGRTVDARTAARVDLVLGPPADARRRGPRLGEDDDAAGDRRRRAEHRGEPPAVPAGHRSRWRASSSTSSRRWASAVDDDLPARAAPDSPDNPDQTGALAATVCTVAAARRRRATWRRDHRRRRRPRRRPAAPVPRGARAAPAGAPAPRARLPASRRCCASPACAPPARSLACRPPTWRSAPPTSAGSTTSARGDRRRDRPHDRGLAARRAARRRGAPPRRADRPRRRSSTACWPPTRCCSSTSPRRSSPGRPSAERELLSIAAHLPHVSPAVLGEIGRADLAAHLAPIGDAGIFLERGHGGRRPLPGRACSAASSSAASRRRRRTPLLRAAVDGLRRPRRDGERARAVRRGRRRRRSPLDVRARAPSAPTCSPRPRRSPARCASPSAAREHPTVAELQGDLEYLRGEWDDALRSYERAARLGDGAAPRLARKQGVILYLRGLARRRRGGLRGAAGSTAATPPRRRSCWRGRPAIRWIRGDVDGCAGAARPGRGGRRRVAATTPRWRRCTRRGRWSRRCAAIGGPTPRSTAAPSYHAERSGDVVQLVRIHTNRGSHHTEEGSYQQAIAELDRAIEIAELIGSETFGALAYYNRGDTLPAHRPARRRAPRPPPGAADLGAARFRRRRLRPRPARRRAAAARPAQRGRRPVPPGDRAGRAPGQRAEPRPGADRAGQGARRRRPDGGRRGGRAGDRQQHGRVDAPRPAPQPAGSPCAAATATRPSPGRPRPYGSARRTRTARRSPRRCCSRPPPRAAVGGDRRGGKAAVAGPRATRSARRAPPC